MPVPTRSSAYPLEFREALLAAIAAGELVIPSPNPHHLRLHFYGYFKALRREAQTPELADALSIHISPDKSAVILRTKERTPVAADIRSALASATPATSAADAFLASLLQTK
jgi:hypothetical protein